MKDHEPLPASAIEIVDRFRYLGWCFLILGCLISVEPVRALFIPNATIQVDGEPTSDFATKVGAVGFVLIFPLVGGLLALPPRKTFERWFSAFLQWSQAFAFGSRR